MIKKAAKFNLILFLIMIFLAACTAEKKEVQLACKFDPHKIYHFVYDSKVSSRMYENDSLTYAGEQDHNLTYTRRALELLDDNRARLLFEYAMKKDTGQTSTWSTACIMQTNGGISDFETDSSISYAAAEYYQNLFEQTSPVYPEEPVSEGYKWSHSVKVLVDEGRSDANTTYTIKSLVREGGFDCAVIEYQGNILIPLGEECPGEKAVITGGMDRIEVEGVAYFAYKEGLVIREEENSHLVREGTLRQDKETIRFKIDENRYYSSRLIDIETME